MRYFDYSFLKTENIPSHITQLLISINQKKVHNELHFSMYKEVYRNLESIARIQSIKASNAIEGIVTTDKRLLAIVNENTKPLNRAEEEIFGYKDILKIIHDEYPYLGIKNKDILYFHRTLYNHHDFVGKGKFKTEDNAIVSMHQGIRRIVFEPTAAYETEIAMEQLYLAYLDASGDHQINKLLLIACYILDFLCIHPFSDGNGRTSRLVTLLLLYKNNYDVGKYISLENSIIEHKEQYYDALEKSSKNWHENKSDYFPFIENFLMVLDRCYQKLESRFSIVQNKKLNKKERIWETINASSVPLSKSDIQIIWPDISKLTIAEELGKLEKDGKIYKIGTYKNARYKKKE